MNAFEIILLCMAYTFLSIAIFLQVVCYKRNLENLETIGLTFSLLILVVTLTVTSLSAQSLDESTNVFILLAMILVATLAPLNILSERQHRIKPFWNKLLIVISLGLFLTTLLGYIFEWLEFLQYVVVIFLGASIVSSMVLVRMTKPREMVVHREKADRIFAIAFMIIIPLSLAANYVAEMQHLNSSIGFTVPLVFILLAASKISDDLQRLSLFKTGIEAKEQSLINYSLTKREKEIAQLLIKGKTYEQISKELFISMPTVKSHTSNIYKKCQVKTRSELTHLLNH